MAATINSELMALAVQAKQEKKVESGLFSNLNTFINMGDRSGEALEYFRLSEYYAVNKQYDKALHYFQTVTPGHRFGSESPTATPANGENHALP